MKKWNIDTALSKFKRAKNDTYSGKELSEADTRSKLIDYILIDCLGWSEEDIIREERCVESNTYLDYKLSTNMPIVIVEAKKSSIDFNLPQSTTQREYKVGGVLSSCKVLIKAMLQARDYAISKGVTFCCVTNGNQFVFFRAQNQQGIDWTEHKVCIFRNIDDIEINFDCFCKHLSKASAENGQLQQTLTLSNNDENGINRFKTLDTTYLNRPRKKDRNPLFPLIGEIIHRVFQDLASEEAESEILEHCYVDSPKKKDKNSPYLDREIHPLNVTKKGAGDFQQRISSALKAGKTDHTEVVFLIGSVGVGKSTFIQRFRKVLAKKEIDNNGVWIYLNFKHFSDTGESLDNFIYEQIDQTIKEDYESLAITEWNFLKQAYHSEYENLKRGALAPIYQRNPEDFEIRFSEKIEQWSTENKEKHFTKLLTAASKRLKKSVFLVFDNADQLKPETQNNIFLAAQKLAEKIKCYALIAMREESYWKNRDSGPLNAFHTTAYHVQPASLQQVLSKRFQYAKSLIEQKSIDFESTLDVTNTELIRIFDRIVQTLLGSDKSYIDFIESTSARDTRRALDNIAAFMISGHTNIEAILKDERRDQPKGFPIPFHEFLNSIILRDHEVFVEEFCDTVNIFNATGTSDASNFNRLAVLGRILQGKHTKSEIGNGYVLIEDVINDCHAVGILPETTTSTLSLLNSRRLIETETTIKESLSQSKYIRTTIAGDYYINTLSSLFGYLDLIIYETPIARDKNFRKLNKVYMEIAALSSSDKQTRLKRVKKRVELTETFIEYLFSEYQNCSFKNRKDKFAREVLDLMTNIRNGFNVEKQEIIASAESIFGK